MNETNKKQVIIYYSLTGCVKKVVSEISKLIYIDIIELKPQKPYSKISAFTKGILQNFFGKKPKIILIFQYMTGFFLQHLYGHLHLFRLLILF